MASSGRRPPRRGVRARARSISSSWPRRSGTAALEALAAFYDAIARPFQLALGPGRAEPAASTSRRWRSGPRAGGSQRALAAYAALYREIAAAPRRPLRRTYLLLDAASEPELRRAIDEPRPRRRGARASSPARSARRARRAVGDRRPGRDGVTGSSATLITGERLTTALAPARRWPAEVEPGWLDGAPGGRRRRPRSRCGSARSARAEAMAFMTDAPAPGPGGRPAGRRAGRARRRRARAGGRDGDRRPARGPGRPRAGSTSSTRCCSSRRADRADALASGSSRCASRAAGLGLELEVATFRLADAWRSALPGPAPRPLAERNLDSASLAASLLHAASDLYEPTGHLYGRARTSGAPIVLDRFAHASHNAIVLGQTGTGKTMFTGAEMSRCLIRGIRVLAVDPLGDYRRLADELGGTYLELGAPGVGLNPFAFTGTATDGALTAKIAALTRLVAAMAGGLTRDERPALDRALRATYDGGGHRPRPGVARPRRRRRSPTSSSSSRRSTAARRWRIGSSAGRRARSPTSSPAARRCRSIGGCSSSASPRSATRRCARSPSSRRSGCCGTPCGATSRPSSSSSTRPGR